MLQTFDCPKCGAPVSYEPSSITGGAKSTLRCDYCQSQLLAPAAGQPARVVRIQVGFAQGSKFPKWIWVVFAIPLLGVLVFALAMLGVLTPALYSASHAIKEAKTSIRPSTPPKETSNALLKFGSEGVGPGMFTDARSIAVDGAGRIYVGEYTGGRIQVFDPEGKFLTQWTIGDRKTLLRGLAADRKGVVYTVHGGIIDRYKGETGE